MDALLQRLALLTRAESLAIRLRAKRVVRTTTFSAAAFAAAVLAFGLINLGAYLALAARYGDIAAALVLAAVDIVLAVLLLSQARRRAPTSEEVMVDELRALALAELGNDTARLKAQLLHLQQQVTQIGEGISRVTKSDPLQLGLSTIGPILSMAARLLNRRKDA